MPDTIVAIATPTGRSGIGVIRLSGERSLPILRKLTAQPEFTPEPRRVYLKDIYEQDSCEVIDRAIILYFQAPHSFTGEDVIEISCHGSPVLLRQIVDICLSVDARLADAGEFTLRALGNGRMDLAEAEAIRDLIDAQTTSSARQAIRQLRGEFSHQLQPIKDELLDVIVVLESTLEFVEDDLPETRSTEIRNRLASISTEIGQIASTFTAGKLIREGLRVAIVGRPNVGKSSLFNALLGIDRAIVTEIAGTTRDQINERFTVSGIPISLIDTAGLRETTDIVESIGVERSRRTIADADLVIAMMDASVDASDEDRDIIESVSGLQHLIVLNKIDIAPNADFGTTISTTGLDETAKLFVSAKTGEGVELLKAAMIAPFAPEDLGNTGFLVTDARHHDLLLRSRGEIENSIGQVASGTSEEIVLIGLHNALRYLGQITGETTTEDMLTRIFSTFCIGK